jgi:hypothetical protein
MTVKLKSTSNNRMNNIEHLYQLQVKTYSGRMRESGAIDRFMKKMERL